MSSSTSSTISSGGIGGAAAAAPVVALSAPLAPGFRFHPTDEELVSYYLKRKVLGRPLRVDAIAEIDLYKSDPWDLPARSVIRSRDGEWYFFSPLDKKYANGSGKTNRATGRGYWKTTGKDRPVRRGGRAVGMKKTLVFHVGKAPKGERTNWVMHEYRLEGEYDDMLRQAGVSQDSYVVCRIFQKAGPGPQNGAQYGAPYVEEEWCDYDDFDVDVVLPVTLPPPAPNAVPAAAAAVAPVPVPSPADEEFKDLLEEQWAIFSCSVGSLLEVNNEKNEINNVDSVCMDGKNSVLDSHQVYDFPMENYIPPEGFKTDDYLELKDFIDPVDLYLPIHQGPDLADTDFSDIEVSSDIFGQNIYLPATNNLVDFPYIAKEEAELMQAGPLSDHSLSSEMDGVLNFEPGEYLLDEEASDELPYSDASNQNEDICEFSTKDNADPQNSVMEESSSADPFDDIAAFFDAPEDNLGYSFPDSSTCGSSWRSSRLANQGDVVALQMKQPSDIGDGNWSRASNFEPAVVSQADIEKFDVDARDDRSDDSSGKTTIAKRFWSMLDSVSAPPALAAEAPLAAKHLVIDPAAWMKANGLTLEGKGKAADGPKPSKDRASLFEPCFRMHNRVASWMGRNGFSFCFSVLLLAASLNIGRCYSRLCFM